MLLGKLFFLLTASPFFFDDGSASHPSGVPRATGHKRKPICVLLAGLGFLFINRFTSLYVLTVIEHYNGKSCRQHRAQLQKALDMAE